MMSNDFPHTLSKETLLNGYEIRLSLKDCVLVIEAKNISTSKIFSLNISQGETAMITRELFSDVESLYDSLIQAINKTDSSIKVSLTDDAILNYSFETLLGKKKKTFEFWIALKEVEIDPISIIQRNVEKLKNMIHILGLLVI